MPGAGHQSIFVPGKDDPTPLTGGLAGQGAAGANQALRAVERFVQQRSKAIAMFQGTVTMVNPTSGSQATVANYTARVPKQSSSLTDLVAGNILIMEPGLWMCVWGVQISGGQSGNVYYQLSLGTPDGSAITQRAFLFPNGGGSGPLNYVPSNYIEGQVGGLGGNSASVQVQSFFHLTNVSPSKPVKFNTQANVWNNADGAHNVTFTVDWGMFLLDNTANLGSVTGS